MVNFVPFLAFFLGRSVKEHVCCLFVYSFASYVSLCKNKLFDISPKCFDVVIVDECMSNESVSWHCRHLFVSLSPSFSRKKLVGQILWMNLKCNILNRDSLVAS